MSKRTLVFGLPVLALVLAVTLAAHRGDGAAIPEAPVPPETMVSSGKAAPEMPAPQMPAPQMPASEMPASEMPASEEPASEGLANLGGAKTWPALGQVGFLRGMTISCPRSGQIWGTEAMRQALQQLRPLGVEWVSIHPYSWIGKDGALRFRPAATVDYLEQALAITSQEGFQMFLKPHLGYWGSFEWRGAIRFDDDAAWRRFFDGYREFIVDQARLAERHGVPLLAVGVELDATVHHEAEWRAILAAVRAVYKGSITYSANWDTIDRVPFWDAVDLIGVQAYFPLSSAEDPSDREILAAWDSHLKALEALSKLHDGKKVLFTEIGYNRSLSSAREPWAYSVDDSPASRTLRRRLMDTALRRLGDEPIVAGLFWWKWMPGSFNSRSNFSMRDPEAQAALADAWGSRPAKASR